MSQQQRTIEDYTLVYTRIVERYAHLFDRPEVRLRFLHRTLAKQSTRSEQLKHTRRAALLKRIGYYDWALEVSLYRSILEELNSLLPGAGPERRKLILQHKAPLAARLYFSFYRVRYLFYGVGFATLCVALLGLYSFAAWSTRHANTYLAEHYRTPASAWPNAPSGPEPVVHAADGVKYLPDYRPEKVWLVERKDNYERYSNGARILTDYETNNHARGYYLLARGTLAATEEARHEPVGLLYHTSENDLIPFTAQNNDSIETHTRELLEYARRHKSYNYLIDRFGQIYRIVRDDQSADHAGHSTWADREHVFVGLNESFLGVCFETDTEAGAEEQLTEAQLIAGRLLTAVLRSRYNIDDTNCVTHGLVSVNPSNMLIAYHHDWIRGFPFEAMGLSDKYKVAPASISEFGFAYDDSLLALLGGKMWPGVHLAEEEFQRRADEASLRPEDLRRQMRQLYREQMSLMGRLRFASPSGSETLSLEAEVR